MNVAAEMLVAASLAWVAVFAGVSVVAAICYSIFRQITQHASPESRAGATLVYSLLPVCIATLTSILLYFPALSALVLPEHCHGPSCAPHSPETGINAAFAALTVAALLATVGWLLWSPLGRLLKHLRISRLTLRLTQPSMHGGFRVVESDSLMAWCDGLLRPEVYISQGLMQQLDHDDIALVAAHELSHAARRDNLAKLCIDWATLLWPRNPRQSVRHDFSAGAEQSCDRAAVTVSGEANRVAQLIDKLSDLEHALGASSEGLRSDVQQRLQALANPQSYGSVQNFSPWFFLACLWLSGAYLSSHSVHMLLEKLLG